MGWVRRVMTSDATGADKKKIKKVQELSAEQVVAAAMVAQAREQGLSLTGPEGLLRLFTAMCWKRR